MRKLQRPLLSLLLIVALSSSTLAAADFVVVGPKAKTAIVINKDWKKAVWNDFGGHAILQRYAWLATDVKLPVLKSDRMASSEALAKYDFRIWVGRQPEVDRVIGKQLDAIDDDGFIIRCTGKDLYVSGKYWWGTNWAAHDLLERFAGCRWYLMEPRFWDPKHDGYLGPGDIVPKAESIVLPSDTRIVEEPDYKSRWFRIVPFFSFRVRRRDHFHHALRGILPPATLFAQHPDWYPLIKGKRYKPRDANDFQPCVSNPAVVKHVAGRIIAHFNEHPEDSSFSIGMNDSGKFCECAPCQGAAPVGIKDKNQRRAWGFFDFYNTVAERVAKVHPNKRLGCLAYAGLRALPEGSIELHPTIVPYLTLDSAQLFDGDQVLEFRAAARKWTGMTRQMGIYEYMYGGGFVIPRIYNRYLFRNIKERYGVGVTGFYAEAYPNWGLDGPKCWVVSKLLWDTSLDPDELLAEFYANMFGPAGGKMKAYFDFLEETWCTQTLKSTRSNYRWLRDPRHLEIFPPEKCERAWALLLEAERAAPDAAVRKRIDFFKKSFAVTRVLATRYAGAQKANALAEAKVLDGPAVLKALQVWTQAGDLEKARAEAKALGFSAFSTTGPVMLDRLDQYNRGPNAAVQALMYDVVRRAAMGRAFKSADDVRRRTDAVLEKMAAAAEGDAVNDAVAMMRGIVRERGFLFVRSVDTPPTVDGRIEENEWGETTFTGAFYPMVHTVGKTHSALGRRVPERTAFRAVRHKDTLYLAFDMQQDPKSLGGKVTERDTSTWRGADMTNDDTIAMTFVRPGSPFQHVRINVNGAIADYANNKAAWNIAEGKVTKTAAGWQAELALDLKKSNVGPAAVSKRIGRISIARYTRRGQEDRRTKKIVYRGEPSTWAPFTFGLGIIGHGNHAGLMCFSTGAQVLYEGVAAAQE